MEVGMWRILSMVAVSFIAALSFSFEAFCDSKTQSEYVVLHPPLLLPSAGLEMGQRSSRRAHGFELEFNAGFNTAHLFVAQLFIGPFSKEKYGGSFFVKKSYGVVGVGSFFTGSADSTMGFGAGAIYKIGNEWEWSNGFIFGVEWVGIGGSASLDGEGVSATVTPYLLHPYVGWSF